MSKPENQILNKTSQLCYDIIFVPGVPINDKKWNRALKTRMYWSKYLFEHGIAKNVMYSGGAVHTPFIEAEVMKLYGEAIGISKEHIYTEILAKHSTENVYYCYKKARKLGFTTFAIASDWLQTKTLQIFAHYKVDRNIGTLPMTKAFLKVMEPLMTDPIIDCREAFVKDFIPIEDREGFWKRFKGTQGRDLDTSAYG
jgi:uncharacterized SAM-binding protein YcdF (DUF218 family)